MKIVNYYDFKEEIIQIHNLDCNKKEIYKDLNYLNRKDLDKETKNTISDINLIDSVSIVI